MEYQNVLNTALITLIPFIVATQTEQTCDHNMLT